jgi:DNA-binding CsgD family transcriptional regulator
VFLIILAVQRFIGKNKATILKNNYFMDDKLLKVFQKQEKVFSMQHFVETELDYAVLNYHKPFLERLDVIDSSVITIFDLCTREHVFISKKYESILGYNIKDADEEGVEYFNRNIHPDDIILLTEAGCYFMEMSFSVPKEKIREFKVVTSYRMKKADGIYIRVLEQHSVLEFDKRGNAWLALSLLDISPDQDLDKPAQSRLFNFVTGELYQFPPPGIMLQDSLLTRREKEILEFLANGLISKQIADKLCISVNTVNTHRQRIIEKLDVTNTAEAINYGIKIGLLKG